MFTRNQVLKLHTFYFQLSFFMMIEYYNWWAKYFEGNFSKDNFRKRQTISFSNMQ